MALKDIYRTSLTLLTDLYQLTMAYGYWKLGVQDREAVFHLTFRSNPFGGGFTVACGLARVVEFLEQLRLDEEDLEYLGSLTGADGKPLFEPAFLRFLGQLELTCDLDAVPEGAVVFAHEPLLRIQGPLLLCQLLETPLLNLVNFPTLIATKAARLVLATRGEPVIEFGLRRAQGIDGGLSASRAAYIGGCSATSNVLAGKLFGIPVKGTHAHSWVMSFEDEQSAFRAYADSLPNNCVFLVDTYDTLRGVQHAIDQGRRLRDRGHRLLGIRLDSGDLAYLSIEARKLLDQAGFEDAAILASNDLDENIITSLKLQGAAINVWGVGTRLVTAYDQPALGGIYKLSAMRSSAQEPWEYRIKLSEQTIKVSNPGRLQVRRYRKDGVMSADAIYDLELGLDDHPLIVDPLDLTRRKRLDGSLHSEELLVPVFRKGRRVYDPPPLEVSRERLRSELDQLHPGVKRFSNPHQYPVGLEKSLYDLKTSLILRARGLED